MENIDSEKYISLIEKAKEYRFLAIEAAIDIETIISDILINFIGNEETKDVLGKYLFSDAITFERKVILFNSLNKKKLFQNINENKTLNGDIDYIKNLRNLMAHSKLDTQKETINTSNGIDVKFISFTEKNNKEITVKFNNEMSDEPEKLIFCYNVLIKKYNDTTDALISVQKWISEKNRTANSQ
jgi:hypothetical protein